MDGEVEDEDAVETTLGMGNQARAEALVIRMDLIGFEGCPVGEIGDEAVQIAAFDALRAFAAARCDRQSPGTLPSI